MVLISISEEYFVIVNSVFPGFYFFLSIVERYHSMGDLQDCGGVRCGDQFPPHKYIKNTSTCGTSPTEHPLNAGIKPQTSQKARKSPHTWVGQKEKEKKKTKE